MERLFLDAGDAEWEALLFKPDYCIVLNEAWKWSPKKQVPCAESLQRNGCISAQ